MYHVNYISSINIVYIYIYICRSMIDPFGSRAFDRGNTDVLSQILGGGRCREGAVADPAGAMVGKSWESPGG